IVEGHRADGLGNVAFAGHGGVDHVSVGPAVVPVPRQAEHAPEHEHSESGPADREQHQPTAIGHDFGPPVLARAMSTRVGTTMVPTTISDSATSGAWNTRNSTASGTPKAPATMA